MRKLVAITLLFLSVAVFGESRQALLLANGTYKHFSSLATPVKEARDLKVSLEKLGFTVVIVENASKEKMADCLYDFQMKLEKSGGIGFFHYGGHAVQVNGKNYLIPSDVDIPDERRIASRALDVDEVMASMKADVNIVVLDSCRNNPLPAGASRGSSRGLVLSEMKPKNSIIVYSAQPGKTAQDGVFTPILTKKILESKSFTEVLMDVRREVRQQTGNEQSPGEYNELETSVYLAGFPVQKEVTKESIEPIVVEKKTTVEEKKTSTEKSASEEDSYILSLADKAFDEGQYGTALFYYKQDKSPKSYYMQGVIYEFGFGEKVNNSKAVSFYKKAGDYAPALYKMGLHQTYKNGDKQYEYWTRAALQEEPRALVDLARRECEKWLDFDYPSQKTIEYLERASNAGYGYAQYLLGYYYETGKYVSKDLAKALSYYVKAAENTTHPYYSISQIERAWGMQTLNGENYSRIEYTTALADEKVGDLYYSGLGVVKSEERAKEYYRKAANEMSDATLLFKKAYAVTDGEESGRNYVKGFEFFLRSASFGYVYAEANVGWAYRYGYGVKQDFAKAVEWWEKAASKGNAYSQDNLGVMYYNGWGVTQDKAKGLSLFKEAAKNGDEHAKKTLTDLGESW